MKELEEHALDIVRRQLWFIEFKVELNKSAGVDSQGNDLGYMSIWYGLTNTGAEHGSAVAHSSKIAKSDFLELIKKEINNDNTRTNTTDVRFY